MVARWNTHLAVVTQGPKNARLVTDRPMPRLRDGYILVRVVTVALNPTDWKHIDIVPTKNCTMGCDFAGIVEDVGPKVAKSFQKGDRVTDGAFGQYVVVNRNAQLVISDGMRWEDACTIGVGYTTTGQSVYQNLGLTMPGQPRSFSPKMILICGGPTATGTLAIQYAKLSWNNFDMVEEFEVNMVFDYTKPNAAAEIRKYTRDNLKLCFDTVAMTASAQFCAEL
ncbi:hypothetical protein ASPBRDRAFT_49952 [Aspergillus brasiliensis CBS 101740]|uniref:Alcohol dehydrogenase-like N-terminal domain-containing protein n=1 Tax=Aspergillus brasiliensis (strain CBS 101740 / IMI 381727 / IBT 21946) TaxID=767769 RepID=A0A1L9UZ51_ASPBC|nr:hypothetical protein ASPBRDRAFT_49952 [Aspergillus brasiliensis CBS 101740]